jgi:hypothetical protein
LGSKRVAACSTIVPGQIDAGACLLHRRPSLSHSGAFWPIDDRVMWLQTISMAFQMVYGQKEAIKITKEAAN